MNRACEGRFLLSRMLELLDSLPLPGGSSRDKVERLHAGRLRACLARCGLLPLGARDLRRLAPDLFRSRRAARRALDNYPPNSIETLFEVGGYYSAAGGTLAVASYRLAGQRGRASRLLYDAGRWPRPEDARAALAAALGAEVAAFELERVLEPPRGAGLSAGGPGGAAADSGTGDGAVPVLVQPELFAAVGDRTAS